jgi:hypothetical protein
MSSSVLDAALAYASRGPFVFPACPDAKKSHKCADHSNGAKWGMTRDPAEIRRDFARWPNARIGIPTGAINGIVVVEVDTIEGHGVDGAAALTDLELFYDPLPETLQAASPSGSVHRYFKHPDTSSKIRNSASELGRGIDVRGDGGMVIAPPSINPDGRAYCWIRKGPLATMPAWLVELTQDKPRVQCGHVDVGPRSAPSPGGYGAAALEREIQALVNTAPGRRNAALNRASFSLHRLVGGNELDGAEVERRLVEASTANGLIHDDGLPSVLATIESGRRGGLQHPRSRRPR